MSDDGGDVPDGLAAYAKALQKGSKIAEPISDEELQEVRGYVERTIRSRELHNLLLKGPCAAGLLARLDAAESRPSAESVQAAIANAQFILDGDGVLPAYRQLLIDMIAGLTGGEG